MKFLSISVLLVALLPSTAALRGVQSKRPRPSSSCMDVAGWSDKNGNDCAYYGAEGCDDGNLNGNLGLTASTACCHCGGGMESNTIPSATGWQLFRHDSWVWDIDAVELYAAADCNEASRIAVAGATYPDSGHHPDWPPERPFRDNPDTWGGRWDETGGSLYLGIEFPTHQTVQCIRVWQREDGPILIRAKVTDGEWKNVKYIPYVAGRSAGYQTIQIGESPSPTCTDSSWWLDKNNKDCDYYADRDCDSGNLNGNWGLTANTACCDCGGGMEDNTIAAATEWQLFRHDSWVWDIYAVELYSSVDCNKASRIDVAGATYPDSGHHPDWSPERPFRDSPDTWGGRWDETDGSLYLGIKFEKPKAVQCIRVRQREAGPILIRAVSDGEWKNIKYTPYVAGGEDAGFQTIQIGQSIVAALEDGS